MKEMLLGDYSTLIYFQTVCSPSIDDVDAIGLRVRYMILKYVNLVMFNIMLEKNKSIIYLKIIFFFHAAC